MMLAPMTAKKPAGATTRPFSTTVDSNRSTRLFAEIVRPHLADGLSLARWLAGNTTDAEDILQEACVRAFRGIEGFSGENSRAWVLAIVRNTAFSWLAKHRSKALVMVGDLMDMELAAQSAPGAADADQPTPETELLRRADASVVTAAVEELPLPFREVVVLRDINGLSYKDIAHLQGLPIGTVMSRLSRARAQLAVRIRKVTQ